MTAIGERAERHRTRIQIQAYACSRAAATYLQLQQTGFTGQKLLAHLSRPSRFGWRSLHALSFPTPKNPDHLLLTDTQLRLSFCGIPVATLSLTVRQGCQSFLLAPTQLTVHGKPGILATSTHQFCLVLD